MTTPDEPLPLPSNPPAPEPGGPRRPAVSQAMLAAAAVLLLLVGAVVVLYTLLARGGQPLYPNLPTFTPVAGVIEGEPAVVGFSELNEDPGAFRDQRIQVSGDFASVAQPDCAPFAGPAIRWSLVAEELQLNAIGFENVLRLLEEGTPMTVTGIWRVYQGPAGCGKEPPDASVWYLAVDQIIEPNPLFGGGDVALTVMAGSPLPTLPPLDLSTVTPGATPTLTATLVAPATVGATATFGLPATVAPSPTLGGTGTATTSPTATVTGTLPTPGTPGTPGTPTITGTPGPSPTPSPTGQGGGETTPSIPTATQGSGEYPVETPTTDGYP